MKFFIVIFPLFLLAQDNYTFGPNVKVNDDLGGQAFHTVYSSGGHAIAARGDTVYVAYRGDQTGSGVVYFSKSTDAGQTWTPGLRVNYPNRGLLQSLTVDNKGDIFIAYTHVDSNSQRDVHFTKSTDGGLSFSYPVMVSDDTSNYWTQQAPALAVDTSGQQVFVAWMDARDYYTSQWDIYFARSTDGGLTFEPDVRVDDTGSDSSWQVMPGIAIDRGGESVYVTWQDRRNYATKGYDIYFSRSTDGGFSFLPNVLVNDTATTGSSHQTKSTIAVDTLDRIFIAWRDERQPVRGCYFSRSDDGGYTFGSSIRVTDDPYDIPGDHISLAVDDSDGVYVVWGQDMRLGSTAGWRIYFAYSDCAGDSFLPNVRVDDLPVNMQYDLASPTLAINRDKKVFIAWDDDRYNHMVNWDIFVASGVYLGIEESSAARPIAQMIWCYPNPFRNALSIRLQLPNPEYQTDSKFLTELKIYDAAGREIRQWDNQAMRLGDHVIWDGRDARGIKVPAGIYFYHLRAGDKEAIGKVIKITGGD